MNSYEYQQTVCLAVEICENLLLESVDAGRQPPATTQLVGLQSLVRFWKEYPTEGVQGVVKRIRSRLEQAADFQYVGNVSPLTSIDTFSGASNGKIKADFYDDCQNIPDPSALDHMQKNLLLLDDCFLGKQNNAEAYCTRGRHNNCDMIYIAQNYFRTYSSRKFKLYYPVPTRCKESNTYSR